jgi:spore germination protein YaaH
MRRNYVWLRMVASTGTYPIPTSESDYNAHLAEIDGAMPTNGGKLLDTGEWEQDWSKTSTAFAKGLRDKARTNGQVYLPIVQIDRTMVAAILDSPTIQALAVTNLIKLMNSRYDAPWDGVLIDFEVIPSAYKAKLSAFYTALSVAVKADGKVFGVSAGAIYADDIAHGGLDYDDAYSDDYAVLAQVADFIDVRCYCYWNPVNGNIVNRGIAPYWWAEKCIQYALSKGVKPAQILMGVGTYSQYVPNLDWSNKVEFTVGQAFQLAAANGETVQWIENNNLGVIREKYVAYTGAHIWVDDGDTTKTKLELVDKYKLQGIDIFIPGCTDALSWSVIHEWRASTMAATTVQLTGISSGYTPAVPVTVTATTANPALFDSLTVNYTNPSTTGSLAITPRVDTEGTTTITVKVDNGKPKNNLCAKIFNVILKKSALPTLDAIADVTIET